MPKLLIIELPEEEIDAEDLKHRMRATAEKISAGFVSNFDEIPLRFVIEEGSIGFTMAGAPEVALHNPSES